MSGRTASRRVSTPWAARAIVVGAILALLVPAAATAHPLGNFTINHYSGLRVSSDRVTVDQVFDLAEIPALQALRETGGTFGPGGPEAYAQGRCVDLAMGLVLDVAGVRRDLALVGAGASQPAGQGGLQTLRLVCTYGADVAIPASSAVSVTFQDGTFPERIGWREIVVEGSGVTLQGDDVPTTGVSARLTEYPDDLLTQPLARSAVELGVVVGGPLLPALTIPDAVPITAAVGRPAEATSDAQASGALAVETAVAAVPGGVQDLPPALTDLLRGEVAPPIVMVGLLLAIGLGVVHALTPGHGKTVMAAYLVGTRGDARQALGLGATVAVSHTLGVLVLAVMVLAASSVLPTERLFPILTAVSAVLVTGMGIWLLWDATRRIRARASAHARGDGHHHEHAVEAHPDHGEHVHSHGPGSRPHSHLPPTEPGRPIRWRGIVTLGLAGGLVPSASAILLMLGAAGAGRPLLGVGLVAAFGLGMAGVLCAIGLLLVRARTLAERLPSMALDGRLGLATSMAAATVVLGFGLLLVGQAFAGAPL